MHSNSDNPTAPSAGLTLFNCDDQSDVIFLVSTDPANKAEKWRFPGHTFVIQESCPILHKFVTCPENFNGFIDGKPIINIQCQPNIFYLMMSFIYTKEAKIPDTSTAILLLQVADKFFLVELTEFCYEYLCASVNEDSVLEVFAFLHPDTQKDQNGNLLEQSPVDTDEINHKSWFVNSEKELLGRCYSIIDAKCDRILQSDGILKLNSAHLNKILFRDSLNLSSELIVFHCVERWATFHSRNLGLQTTTESKMRLLGDLVYSARYLLMDLDDFVGGPYASDLLPEYDRAVIKMAISQQSDALLPEHLRPFKLNRPRRYVKPTQVVTPQPRKTINRNSSFDKEVDNSSNNSNQVAVKKKGPMKKILNGLGEVMICVIQLLD